MTAFLRAQLVRLRQSLHRGALRLGFPADWYLIPLAALVGTAGGLAAVAYGKLVHASEEFFFSGGMEGERSAVRLWLFIALPAIGAMIVGVVKAAFQLPRISHGVPEVIESMARRGGRLSLRSGFFTAFNSAVTLGSGGAAGQEGPIVHIGSIVGSKLGQWLQVGRQHMATLIGCGAAAGLAAIFNAPIAGVLLVLEVILRDFSIRTFMPVVIASVFGVAVSQTLLGRYEAVFFLPKDMDYHFAYAELLPFLVLGILCALVGVGFSKTLYAMEHAWEHKPRIPAPLKPALGGLLLGLMGVLLVLVFPHYMPHYKPPAFMGNGYRVIETVLQPEWYETGRASLSVPLSVAFLLCIAAGKVVGTSLTLGSGGSGGVFAPALFIGASTGGAFGILAQYSGLYAQANPALYALAGMAGVLTAAIHCPLTAMILVFEITQDYTVILPIMLVTILATVISQVMQRDSIYILALRERGIRMGTLSDMTLLRRLDVTGAPLEQSPLVRPHEPVQRLIELLESSATADFVVADEHDRYIGLISGDDVRTTLLQRDAVPLMIVSELMRTGVPTTRRDETLDVVLDKFAHHDVDSLAVVDEENRVLGLITRTALMRQYQESLERDAE